MGAADHTVFIAWLAFSAAVLAALIAAFLADWRQRRQLKHDRQLKDLAELRSVLDEATTAMEGAVTQLQDVFASFGLHQLWASEDEDVKKILDKERATQYNADMSRCADDRDGMILAAQRIAIRLGNDAPLYRAYQSAVAVVIEIIRQIGKWKRAEGTGEEVPTKEIEERNSELSGVRSNFVALAVARVGSQLP